MSTGDAVDRQTTIIDVNLLRRGAAALHELQGLDEAYTFYYDETNNHRRIRIRDDGLNVQPPQCFVLGGIVHAGPRRALPAAELRTALRLDRGIVDMKLKHLGKGNICELLASEKVGQFLAWLRSEKLLVHFQALDPLYWGIVDIIESILAELAQLPLFAVHMQLKDALYILIRADLDPVIALFREFRYPDIGKERRNEFLSALRDLLRARRTLLPDFDYRMLDGVLRIGQGLQSLPFLEDGEPHVLLDTYRDFYVARLCMFTQARHILDEEGQVAKEFEAYRFMDGARVLDHFRFARSHDEDGIQISDVLTGLLGKLFSFAIERSQREIVAARSGLNPRQHAALATLNELLDLSSEKNTVFASYVLSPYDQHKIALFLEGEAS